MLGGNPGAGCLSMNGLPPLMSKLAAGGGERGGKPPLDGGGERGGGGANDAEPAAEARGVDEVHSGDANAESDDAC